MQAIPKQNQHKPTYNQIAINHQNKINTATYIANNKQNNSTHKSNTQQYRTQAINNTALHKITTQQMEVYNYITYKTQLNMQTNSTPTAT